MEDREKKVVCWGCDGGFPVRDGYHVEPTDIPHTVYTYPCTAIPITPPTERMRAGARERARIRSLAWRVKP